MEWLHPVCATCYAQREPGRTPHRVVEADTETCCGCGASTRDGIYYRAHPATMPRCPGEHT